MTLAGRAAGRRIDIVLHSFDRGGSGRVAAYLARGFADLGMIVRVLLFADRGPVEAAARALIGPGVPIEILGRAHGPRALDLIRGLPALISALRRDPPEIVLAAANNVALPTALAFRAARLAGSRLYLKTTNPIASSRHRGIARTLRRAGYRAIFPWTDGVLTLSGAEADEMDAAFAGFRGLFRDVANPYVTPAMLAAGDAPDAAAPPTIVSLARLDPQKRLERLIAAFAQVTHPGARLLILGEGAERAALEALVARLGISARVAMPGHVADVVPALRAARLFVLTSDYEGLPAAALEAMAANCPVLATPCFPSARTLLTAPGCGVIEDTAPAALAAQLDACLDRPRPQTLSRVAERYSIANGIASHVEAMLAAGPTPGVKRAPPARL